MTEVRVCHAEARVIVMTEVRIGNAFSARCLNAHSDHRYAVFFHVLGLINQEKGVIIIYK